MSSGPPDDAPLWHGEFRHPRLVEVYDAECPWSRDDELFLAIVAAAAPRRLLDLGCGTGRLTLALAAALPGCRVTGVDPAAASLDAARRKPGAGAVEWVEGTSSVLADLTAGADSASPASRASDAFDAFDAATMTSHVAQFLVSHDEWARTLADLARVLRPGGLLVFDSRDPQARAWERWNPVDWRRDVTLPDGTTVCIWTEVTAVAGDVVTFVHHYEFADGAQLATEATMRFRSEGDLRSQLAAAGFAVDAIYGGWSREPVGKGDGELIVVAHRR